MNEIPDLSRNGGQQEPQTQLIIPPEQFGGVWANHAAIATTAHEVTIDFYRIGPGGQQGFLVSRINCNPLLAADLLEQLQQHTAERT